MATLVATLNDGKTIKTPIFKPVTTIGADPQADCQIPCAQIPSIAAHIKKTGNDYCIFQSDNSCELYVNDKKIAKQYLKQGDTIFLNKIKIDVYLSYSSLNKLMQVNKVKSNRELEAYKRLLSFSNKLATESSLPKLLESLIDEILKVTKAESGFLVLVQDNMPKVKVSRNIQCHVDKTAKDILSESIIKKVLLSKKPILVSDASANKEFNSSHSVINYKITSVMCAPLICKGKILGAIYVGNNSFTNIFDDSSLEILEIFSSQAALLVQNIINVSSLEHKAKTLEEKITNYQFGEIIGSSKEMQCVFSTIEKVSSTDATVLLTGETGTGRELIAKEIHARSPRAKEPMITINCGAIPESLLESELFGVAQGAQTITNYSRWGRFHFANNGTVFLDEVGEMPPSIQIKLLRVLQDKKITRLGDNKSTEVNIRFISATNKNLDEMVRKGLFREDLFYRLNVVQISVPPLRNRKDDILIIADFFLKKFISLYDKDHKKLSSEAKQALINYCWPGNIRELENKIKRCVIMSSQDTISLEDLDLHKQDHKKTSSLNEALELYRQKYISDALCRNNGNRTLTAKELGIDPRTIFRHLQKQNK